MDEKHFVAIGRIIFETPGFDWNIPHTHFIVNKTASGNYEATNLEFVLDSLGGTVEESAQNLSRLVASYVMDIMIHRKGHDDLITVVKESPMEDYWAEYRAIEVELSRTKRDMSHYVDRQWVTAIKETLDENIKTIIFENAKNEAEAVYSALRKMIPEGLKLSFEYRNLEAA